MAGGESLEAMLHGLASVPAQPLTVLLRVSSLHQGATSGVVTRGRFFGPLGVSGEVTCAEHSGPLSVSGVMTCLSGEVAASAST